MSVQLDDKNLTLKFHNGYEPSANQIKIIHFIVDNIILRMNKSKFEKQKRFTFLKEPEILVTKNDFTEITGINSEQHMRDLMYDLFHKYAVLEEKINTKSISYKNDNLINRYTPHSVIKRYSIHFFSTMEELGEGFFKVTATQLLTRYLIRSKHLLPMGDLSSLKSKYSLRLYEYFKTKLETSKHKEYFLEEKLKDIYYISGVLEHFSYARFKIIFNESAKEISEHTDILVKEITKDDEKKSGRKVVSVTIKISKKD